MSIKDMDASKSGAHHCTRENISHTIAHLKNLEENTELTAYEDWPTMCGIYALQMSWLLSHIDS